MAAFARLSPHDCSCYSWLRSRIGEWLPPVTIEGNAEASVAVIAVVMVVLAVVVVVLT